jgi:hypothetical protein
VRRGGGGGIGNELRPKTPGVSNLGQFVRRDRRLAYLQRVDVETIGFLPFSKFSDRGLGRNLAQSSAAESSSENSGYIML